MKMISGILFFVLMAILCRWVSGQPAVPSDKTDWTAQEIRLVDLPDEIVAVLENGMVAIVKENHTAPVADVRLMVKAGSIYEQEYLGAGLSHLFEHLLVRGTTTTRSQEESVKIIQQIGARWNAYTSKEQTCYFLTVPAQHVGTALSLIADWVTRPTFPEEAFIRELGVVQREQEMGASDPDRQLYYLFDELRYQVHPARYPVIGYQAVLRQITRPQIIDYYRRMYVPDNTIVAVAGDINAAEMLEAIKKEFADFTRRAKTNMVLPSEPEITAPREMKKVMPSLRGPAKMRIGFPSIILQNQDLYALDVLAGIMGSGKSSRLYRSLRERQELVTSISAFNFTPHWAVGSFIISCEMEPDKVDATRAAIWGQIDLIKNEGVTTEELNRVKRQLQVDHIRSQQTAYQQTSTMAGDYLATGDPHFSDNFVKNIQDVTAQQVQLMARKYLNPPKQILLVLSSASLTPVQAGERKETTTSEIKKIILDNGLRVLLKRNPAVPLVNMQLYVLGGLLEETDDNSGLTNLMAELSTKGTTHFTAEEIIDYFDGVGGSLNTRSGNNSYYYSAEVMSGDFPGALEIFSEIVVEPNFPQTELDKLKPQVLADIAQIDNSWSAQAERFFRCRFFTNNPYKRVSLGTTDSVSAISREHLQLFHQNSTVGARAVLAVFGDIDLAATENLVRQRLGAMPKGDPLNLDKFPPASPPTAPRQFVEKTDKTGATVYVGFPGIKLTEIQERYPLDVLTEIIGSTSSSDWLFGKLRGAQLVYYARGFDFAGVLPGYIAATAQCEAPKVPQVLGVIRELLAKASQGQFTEDELARAKSKLINAEIMSKQTNAEAAVVAVLDELYGFGYDWSKGHADRIMAVSLKDVQNVGRKYLTAPATVTIITSQPDILDEKKPE